LGRIWLSCLVLRARKSELCTLFPNMATSFLFILLAVFVYGLVHSVLASLEVKALAQRWFGSASERAYRVSYNLFAMFSFLPVLALVGLLPDHLIYNIPFPWSLFTLAAQFLAVVMLGIGLLQTGLWSFLGVRQLLQPTAGEIPVLVVSGLYRRIRHPLYTAGLLFIWLTPQMTGNLLSLNIGLTIYIMVGAIFEERKLVRQFGEAYVEYQERTPMLIPRIGRVE
jgi:methanethiol S-methyltransferase